jgi:transposase
MALMVSLSNHDAGKKINGRKRHLLVDTKGLLIAAIVHRADIQDRDGAPLLLATVRHAFPWLPHIFADAAYAGGKLQQALAKLGTWTLEIIRRSDTAKGFEPLPRRWVVERAIALTLSLSKGAQPQSPSGQGLRSLHRERAGLALHRQRQAPHPSHRKGVSGPSD